MKHIVESWGMDVRASATYNFAYHLYHDDEPLDEYPISIVRIQATPLFVAALNEHQSIVRYLVGKGADLTIKTSGLDGDNSLVNLTPLNGAFKNLQHSKGMSRQNLISIIRFLLQSGSGLPSEPPGNDCPLWMLDACCDAEVLNDLINYGMDRSYYGTPILHHWASLPPIHLNPGGTTFDPLPVVQLLVNKGADLLARDGGGRTPILIASLASDIGPTFHLKAHDTAFMGAFNFEVFDFFLEREEIGRMEKIEALELAGAEILSGRNTVSDTPDSQKKAFEYW